MLSGLKTTTGYKIVSEWLRGKGYQPFVFQKQTWQHIINGESGLVNAPTGCGKTFSVFLGALIDFINHHPDYHKTKKKNGLQLIWITPLRALAKDIGRAMEEVVHELGISWKIGTRNGDTPISEREKQKKQMPEVLIITPESLHLLLAQKGYPEFFKPLKIIAVDEWHELLGSKRGVQVELAISRIVSLAASYEPQAASKSLKLAACGSGLSVWGISATIGNLEQSKEVLLAPLTPNPSPQAERGAVAHDSRDKGVRQPVIVRADLKKQIEVESIFPDEIEKFP